MLTAAGHYFGDRLGPVWMWHTVNNLVSFGIVVYYSSLILFLGAEFTRAYANRFGGHILPKPNAMPLTPEARAQQGLEPHSSGPKAA